MIVNPGESIGFGGKLIVREDGCHMGQRIVVFASLKDDEEEGTSEEWILSLGGYQARLLGSPRDSEVFDVAARTILTMSTKRIKRELDDFNRTPEATPWFSSIQVIADSMYHLLAKLPGQEQDMPPLWEIELELPSTVYRYPFGPPRVFLVNHPHHRWLGRKGTDENQYIYPIPNGCCLELYTAISMGLPVFLAH
ncbi:expressed unknown protein [Seminavis robusta]|uniref:Uncharacterized protein n=1 Tax=Seminavis robusta TaxID=568900 RepID=A0A9N8ESQ7_9STRA|nr:expressed unknown protein [Seminavis robusta]|eukprot:Sro1836_g300700.1 n/a (195) ;mRNA; r:16149-16733